ncbi:MAG: helix-turn-helix domain-containing protein [archaeon]
MFKVKIKNGMKIKKKIYMQGMTMKEFAKKINKSPEFLSKIIHEKANPSPTTANDITEILNEEFSELWEVE